MLHMGIDVNDFTVDNIIVQNQPVEIKAIDLN